MRNVWGDERRVHRLQFVHFAVNIEIGVTAEQHHAFLAVVAMKRDCRSGCEFGDAIDEPGGTDRRKNQGRRSRPSTSVMTLELVRLEDGVFYGSEIGRASCRERVCQYG